MPLVDFRQARREARLAVVLELLRRRPHERAGEQVRGACPLHGSTAPRGRSFSAHLGRGVWRCFRWSAGGNALDLWALATGQRLYQAVLDLYGRRGVPVPWLAAGNKASRLGDKADAIAKTRA